MLAAAVGGAYKATMSNASSGKLWFLLSGVLCIPVGFFSMAWPGLASVAITQLVGALCVVSGVFLLFSAIFGKANHHRILDFCSAVVRLALGLLLLVNVIKGVLTLTLVLACVFVAEGILALVVGFRLKGKNPAWGWVVANGVVALVLGGLLLAKFPADAVFAIGLLFGINMAFTGFSLVMYGLGLSKAQAA
jgi:uncharacterized membrane protein HdeD (DUF308 family)